MEANIAFRMMVLHERDPQDDSVVRSVCLNCPDLKAEENLCLQILTARFTGKHRLYNYEQPQPPVACKWKREDLAAITDEEERRQVTEIVEQSATEHAEYKNDLADWNAVQKCIAEENATLAHHLLRDRFGGYDIVFVKDRYEPLRNYGSR